MAKTIQRTLWFEEEQQIPLQLLTVDEIYSRASERILRSLKEDKRIERKPANFSGDSLGVYFSMWANTAPDGGLIVSGIADNGDFEGCKKLTDEGLNKLEKAGHIYCPDARYVSKRVPVTNLRGQQDFVVVFRVFYNERMLVKTTKGDSYTRIADEKHKMHSDEARQLSADKKEVSFEEQECRVAYPDGFDLIAIRNWAANVRTLMDSGFELTDAEIMANRRLGKLEKGQFVPNIACLLLFGIDPCSIIPGSKVRFLRYEGEFERSGEQYNVVKEAWFEGTVPSIIEQCDTLLKSQLRMFSRLDKNGKFYTSDEYPRLAWYEALVNACVHRSYGNGMKNMDVFVRMFDDHLEVESPGPFPPFVTAKNIYDMHLPRNPRLMEAMRFLGFVKMNREGTRRMRDTMAEMQLPEPEFSQSQIGHALVKVKLQNNIKQRKVWVDAAASGIIGAKLFQTLSENERLAINCVAVNGSINVSDLQRQTGLYWKAAKDVLTGLCTKGIFREVRNRPAGERDPGAFFELNIPSSSGG